MKRRQALLPSAALAEQYVALLLVSCQTTFAEYGQTTVLLVFCTPSPCCE
jgi:hypothetical protein